MSLSVLFSFVLAAAQAGASGPAPCPPQGAAQTPGLQAFNVKCNRTEPPSDSDIDDTATLEAMLEPGSDPARWDDSNGVEVKGYVISVSDAGARSADCFAAREIHIDLAGNSAAFDPAHRVIAVVTPFWRRKMADQGVDWSLDALQNRYQGQWLKVRGWLLYNFQAEKRAVNTAEDAGSNITRATAWEIHPVTSIELESNPFDE